jgi:hypothetical protein
MAAEEWRPIVGFPDYVVSNTGRVVSYRRGKPYEMRGSCNQRGYRMVMLSGDGVKTLRTVHRLVATAFLGPLPEGMETRHLDGDKANNAVSNLGFCTPSENILDQVKHGVHNMARKTHCKRGHPFDEVNTQRTPDGRRACRACRRNYQAAYAADRALRAANVPLAS